MPGKRQGGVSDLTVKVLREIRDEAKKTNTRLDRLQVETHQGFKRLDQRMDELRVETHNGFDHLGTRIDNLHEELRGRVERIEQHLGLD